MTTTKHTAHWTLEALSQSGVKTIVFSPGSRNAPLIIAAEALGCFKLEVLGDERSAAFNALGRSLITGLPVAVCCTSGSALANYYPAILEAFYAHVPLIVISADRPEERINKGEGQTCVQRDFYEPHVAASVHINEQTALEEVAEQLEFAFRAQQVEMRPIHINLSFDEPLYAQEKPPVKLKLTRIDDVMELHGIPDHQPVPTFEDFAAVAVIAGQLLPQESDQVRRLLDEGVSWTLFADPMSGLLDHPSAAPMEKLLALKPDAVLSIGGQWINKKPKQHLRSLGIKKHVHIDVFQCWDVLDAEVHHLRMAPNALAHWKSTKEFIQIPAFERSRVSLPWSDAAAFQSVVSKLAPSDVLHLGNSSIARYFNYFPKAVALYGNRGVAGIDGSLSTAVGAALADPKHRHILIIGDQSFIYDHNGLYGQHLPENLTVCVLNNGVGGLFDWLPETASTGPEAQRVFANAQQVNLEGLALAFGVTYAAVSSIQALSAALEHTDGPKIIDSKTHQRANLVALTALG
ncbi:MAG: 2-succinyl-5-enolpyruvyl-6-hydroxy-3-cyclohexene-1-carboxylic-acid synthase [Schleiferiaceae bacterium]|nr:2-succinyl-5-enolpyruvyl-6-hydroxy-3-cyclohexene-1-carboxylic-acid synthase [Schleiferiaceae bacterium]